MRSIEELTRNALPTLLRFPFVMLSAAVGVAAVLLRVENDPDLRYLMAASLGLSLFLGITLFAERRGWSKTISLVVQLGAAGLLVAYFFSLPPEQVDRQEEHMIRYLLLNLSAHMLVAFAAYTSRDEVPAFWRFNQILFLRILVAILFTAVLYGGLALALLAVDRLFRVDVDGRIFGDLFAILAGIFNTWFFLAGVPRDFATLETEETYPRGLKIFTQYVLLPLVTVYLIILYFYSGKIVVLWEWPVGWVSSLILAFSVAGIFSFLLLYPIRDLEGNRWIKSFSRWFYWALFPLIVLLFLAIGRRVSDYGLTESRYFVIALALWLGGIAIYFLASRRDNIKVIPISLCILSLLSTFGPWGAFGLSKRSQMGRLQTILTESSVMVNGRVKDLDSATIRKLLPPQKAEQIRSILWYLDDHEGALEEVVSWMEKKPDSVESYALLQALGVDYYDSYSYSGRGSDYFHYRLDEKKGISVQGYEYYLPEVFGANSAPWGERQIVWAGSDTISMSRGQRGNLLQFYRDDVEVLSVDLSELAQRLAALPDSLRTAGNDGGDATLHPDLLTVERQGKGIDVKLVFELVTVHKVDDTVEISSYDLHLLMRRTGTNARGGDSLR